MIHWTWVIFSLVIISLIGRLIYTSNESHGDYAIDLESPLILILLIAFVLIWGGIFWW